MLLFFFLSLPITYLLYLLLHKTRKPTKNSAPPGPPGLPLIGNIHQFATAKLIHIYLWQLSKKYGPLIHLKLASKPLLVISSAKLAKEVMKTQDLAFCSRPKHYGQQRLAYNCSDIIFSPYNDYWKEVRKIAVINLLSPQKLQSFRSIRKDEVSRVVKKISGFASSNRVVDMSEIATGLSSSLICRIAFGKRYDEHGSENRRFRELLHEIVAVASGFYVSDYFPRLGWVDKLSGLIKFTDTVFKKSDSFYQELIDEHLSRKKEAGEEDDILDILIRLKEERSCSVDLEWDNIKALLMNIFGAASDTSAASIEWTMAALIKAPHEMKKVQAEIRDFVGEKGIVDEIDLPKLPYLKAVINESLRLYPPVPLLVPRETIEKCILDGYEIQPKTTVFVNAWAIARDPEYWEKPEEFMPERFLKGDIDIKGQDFEVTPFGSGRRICPGMNMGIANVELTVANMLSVFDWELPRGVRAEDVDMEAFPGIAMHKKNPLLLVPKKLSCLDSI
ncbi:hypothetical protein CASFOL_022138 [Castilleja foliolosa]|uniref:Cytochrome P450 n=1 Tax=Castilleja foliolosa TaxID=1961234 RepID=A0ABD3CZW4_9LAMI